MATVTRRSTRSQPSNERAAPRSSGYRGSEGLARAKQEEANQTARREASKLNAEMPFRFFCPVGETRQIVVIDDKPEELFFRYEHNLQDKHSKRWSVFCACIEEHANCPVCKAETRPPYFGMFLTILDLTPYESEKHGTIEWSKKLMVVKTAQQKKIIRLAEKHGGSLRGMILNMTRDGDKDASIGNDIEFEDFMNEDELEEFVTEFEYKDAQGKKRKKEVIGYEPFDYEELFPMPTEQQLRAIVGGRPEPGSREDDAGVSRRRSRGQTKDEWDDQDDATGDEAPPARRSARTIAHEDRPDVGAEETPRTRPVRRGRQEEPVEAEVETHPARRATTAPPPRRGAVPPTRGRPTRPDPEAEPEEEEQVEEETDTRTSMASRRQALRRR